MCHPGLPPLPPGCAAIGRRERRQAASPTAAAALPPRPHHQAQAHYLCVCSPTTHPGSFRCRWHRVGYVWGSRSRRPFAAEGVVATGRAVGGPPAMRAGMAAP